MTTTPQRSPKRIIDANANRAREALRVMEDSARFLLDNHALSKQLKSLRHQLAQTITQLESATGPIASHRDTPNDTGTSITTQTETTRTSTQHIAIAAAKRLTEALRSLEEYTKLYHPKPAAAFKQLRYHAYEAERLLITQLAALNHAAQQWRLCVIISQDLCTHHDWLDIARASIEAGADCIQHREKSIPDNERLKRARQLVELSHRLATKTRRTSIVINDRPDIAIAAQADGIHLGQDDLPLDAARQLADNRLVLGVSTHNLTEAKRAASQGADYCGVGAIFPTSTKRRKPSGLEYLTRFIAKHPQMPHLAIGGITPDNVARVVEAGGRGVAVSSIVCGASKPGTVVRKLLRAIPKM